MLPESMDERASRRALSATGSRVVSRRRYDALARVVVWSIGAVVAAHSASAQQHDLVQLVQPFPVVDESYIDAPFLGGFDVPRPQFVDIDGDADLDLFVQETRGRVMFFENTGTGSDHAFNFSSLRYKDIDVGGWFFFADIEGDGDPDLLSGVSFGLIRAYRNVGTGGEPEFVVWSDTLTSSNGSPLLAEPPSVPFVADVDCNGRVDLMIGDPTGTISHYELVTDHAEPPQFDLVDDRYQDIEVIGGTGKSSSTAATQHGASALAIADVDVDGDPDLLWGDFFEPNIILFRNDGSCTSASMVRATDSYMRTGGQLLDTSGLNVPRPADIDDDGDVDLFVGVMGGAFLPATTSIENFYFLEATPAGFDLVSRRFLPTIDVGSDAAPALADIDGDGDLDLLIGNVINPEDPSRGSVTLFRNTGTADAPVLQLQDPDFLGFNEGFSPTPSAVDIDGDGDSDIAIGRFDGEVSLYRNVGSSDNPEWQLEDETFLGADVGSDSFPTFGDVDGDGDLDLLVGESSGQINLFRNQGSASLPNLVLETEEFAGIDVGQRSRPRLLDYDGDGDLDLLVGSNGGTIFYYRNDGTLANPVFAEADPISTSLTGTVSPAVADLDGDADADVLVGTPSGGLLYYRNEVVPTSSSGPERVDLNPERMEMYPQPATDIVTIVLTRLRPQGNYRLDMIDALGRKVHSRRIENVLDRSLTLRLNIEEIASGPVLLRLSGSWGILDSRLLIVL